MFMIKSVSISTEKNKHGEGIKIVQYYGKDQELIGCHTEDDRYPYPNWYIGVMNSAKEDFYKNVLLSKKDSLYTRKCDATRSWIYKNPENTEYWQSTVEIIEI